MTETELVKQVAAGAEAFAALVTLYRPALVAFCARRVGGEDAEEAAQDALFKAWQSFSQCKDLGKFKCWVWGIARNECNRRIRKAREWHDSVSMDSLSDFSEQGDLVAGVMTTELLEQVRRRIQRLTPTQRECMEMVGDGMSYAEIARVRGTTLEAVRQNVCRARFHVTNP